MDSSQYRGVQFVVVFAIDGVGRIESRKEPGEPKTRYNAPELYEGGERVFKWDDQVSFCQEGKNKTTLIFKLPPKYLASLAKMRLVRMYFILSILLQWLFQTANNSFITLI